MNNRGPCTAILGAGPGLGAALAERFAQAGHAIALLSRSSAHRDPIIAAVEAAGGQARGFDCDATDAASVNTAFEVVREELGAPEVLIYNAGIFLVGGVLELEADAFVDSWKINCLGAFHAARAVLPAMRERGRGTILCTGATAALRGGARFAGLAVGKFGLRALTQSLAREFGPQGIHVAHIIIDGQIDSPRTRQRDPSRSDASYLAPAAIAESFWQIHCQPRSAWTLEQDLRPYIERF